MSTGRRKLLDEIYEHFLVCKICFEVYTKPKTLGCLHTFCEHCIDRHQSAELERSYRYAHYTSRPITCPICRKKTELPAGGVRRLPDNLIVPRLVDMVCPGQHGGRSKSNNNEPVFVPCEICKIQNAITTVGVASVPVAVSKCLDCCKVLCKTCTEIHRRTKVTTEHSVVDVEVEDKDVTCKTHDGELVRYYCEQCSTCICVVCAFEKPHRGHEVLTFSAALSRHGHSLDSLVLDCKTRANNLRRQLEQIRQLEADAMHAEEQVRGAAIDCIAAIRQHENNLLSALRAVFSDHSGVKAFLAERPAIESTIRSLENTCQLSDVIVQERSVELLLLKDDLASRMTSLLQTTHVELTPEVDAENTVRFVMTSPEAIGHVASGDGLNFGRLEFVNTKMINEKDEKEGYPDSSVCGISNCSDDGEKNSTEFDEGTQRTNSELSVYSGAIKQRATSTDSDDVEMLYVPDIKLNAQTADQSTISDAVRFVEDELTSGLKHSGDILRTQSSTTMYSSVFVENKMTLTDTPSAALDSSTMTSPVSRSNSPSGLRHQRSNEPSKTPKLKVANVGKASASKSVSPDVSASRQVKVRCVATLTDQTNTVNKASSTERPFQLDKSVATLRTRLCNQDTNTHHNVCLDSAVQTVHIPGDDKACGTKTVLVVDAFTSTNDRTMSRSRGATGNGNTFDRLAVEGDVVKSSVRDKIDSFSNSANSAMESLKNQKRPESIVAKKNMKHRDSVALIAIATDSRTSRDVIELGEKQTPITNMESMTDVTACNDDVTTTCSVRDIGTNTESWDPRSAGDTWGTIQNSPTGDHNNEFHVSKQLSTASTSTESFVSKETSTVTIEMNTIETNTLLKHDAETATTLCSFDSVFTNTPQKTYLTSSTNTADYKDEGTSTDKNTYITIETNTETPQQTDIGSNTIETVKQCAESNTDEVNCVAVETNTEVKNSIGVSTCRIEHSDMQTNTSTSCEVTTNTRQLVMSNADTNTAVSLDTSTNTKLSQISASFRTFSTNTAVQQSAETNTPNIAQSSVETNTAFLMSIGTNTNGAGNLGGGRTIETNTETPQQTDIGSNTIETVKKCAESNTDEVNCVAVETNTEIKNSIGVSTCRIEHSDMQTNTSTSCEVTTNTRQLVTSNADTNTAVSLDTSTNTKLSQISASFRTFSTNTAVQQSAETNTPNIAQSSVETNTAFLMSIGTNTNGAGNLGGGRTIETNTETPQQTDIGSNTIETVKQCAESNTDEVNCVAVETNTEIKKSIGVSTCRIEHSDMQTNTSTSCEVTTNTRQLVMSNADTNTAVSLDTSTNTQLSQISASFRTFSTNTAVQQSAETNTPAIAQSSVETNTPFITSIGTNTNSVFNSSGCRTPATMCYYCGHTSCDSNSASVQTDSRDMRDFGAGYRLETVETGTGNSDITTVDKSVGNCTAQTADSSTVTSPTVRLNKETATVQVHMIHRNEATDSVNTTDASTMPADDVTTTYRGALAAYLSRPPSVSRGTSTSAKTETVDNETSTEPRPQMTDAGTVPAIDMTAAYRTLLGRQGGREHLVTISRGTITLRTRSADRQTTTEPAHRDIVDRASSPIRIRGIDKSVSVNRASLTEPTEVFVRPSTETGSKMGLTGSATALTGGLRRQISGSCPRMDSICEGSDESASDSEYKTSTVRRQLTRSSTLTQTMRRPVLPPRPLSDDLRRFKLPIERGVLASLAPIEQHPLERSSGVHDIRENRPTTSVEDESITSLPLRGVEVSTNTTWVERRDQATGTESMTPSTVVDGKMAECINKLRTVRQRLEQQQTTFKHASSPEQRDVCLSSGPVSPDTPPTGTGLQVDEMMTSLFIDESDCETVEHVFPPCSEARVAHQQPANRTTTYQQQDGISWRQHAENERSTTATHDTHSLPSSEDRLTGFQHNDKIATGVKPYSMLAGNSGLPPITEITSTTPQSARALKGDMFPSTVSRKVCPPILPSSPLSSRKNEVAVQSSPRLRPKLAASTLSKPELQSKVITSPPLKRGSQLSSSSLKPRPSTAAVMEGMLRGTSSRTNKLSAIIDEEKASMSGSTESNTSSSGDDQETAMLMRMMSGVQAAGSAAQRSRQHRQLQPQTRQRQPVANTMTSSSSPPSETASPVTQRRTALARKQRLDLTQLLLLKTDDTHSDDSTVAVTSLANHGAPSTLHPQHEQRPRTNPLSPDTTRRLTTKTRKNDSMRF